MGGQLGKVAGRPPALAQRPAPEPGDHPDHMHGGCRRELLEVRARQAKVSTPAEVKVPDPLRQAALHPCPQRILGFELRSLLALPRRLERLMVGLWADRELAGAAWAEVHARRVGHARHVAPLNRMRMTGSPETWYPGRQWTLEWPWGQRACWASPSMTKACRS
jgi:hypothetical protein